MKNLFPVGTIVTIKGMGQPLMITGYYQVYEEKVYDYVGVLYPTGLLSKQSTMVFNHEMLEGLVAGGYKDEDCEKLLKAMPRIVSGLAALSQVKEG